MPVPWNDDVTRADAGETLRPVMQEHFNAYQERQRLQLAVDDFAPTEYAEGEIATKKLTTLAASVAALAGRFVRRFNADGSPWTPQGQPGLDSLHWHYVEGGPHEPLTFPYPNGWRRKFSRCIFALSNPGESGQRARFESKSQPLTSWYGVLHDDALFGTSDSTPEDERSNTGRLYDHDGAAWVLSADQTSPPDTVEEYVIGEASHSWRPMPGDRVGEWVLNDIRDALNQMTVYPVFDHFFGAHVVPLLGYAGDGIWYGADQYLRSGTSLGGTKADVETDYAATEFGPDLGFNYFYQWTFDQGGYGFQMASIRVRFIPAFDNAGPSTMPATAEVYIRPRKPSGDIAVFNNFGLPLSENVWCKVIDGYATTVGSTTPSGYFGHTDGTPLEWPPDPPTIEDYTGFGWECAEAVMLFHLQPTHHEGA